MRIQIIFYRTLSSQSSASLTCGYLAAALRELGHFVQLTLLSPYADSIKEIDFKKVKYVFYKVNFKDVKFLKSNIDAIKKQNPNIKIILLGPYTFFWKDKLLKEYDIDAILLPYFDNDISLDLRRSIYLTKHRSAIHKIYHNQPQFKIIHPARDIEEEEPLKIANIEAARGCYNHCSFCHVSQICQHFKVKIFKKSVSEIMEEIKQLISMGKHYFIFNDPVLWGKNVITGNEIEKFCQAVSSYKNIYFMAYMTLNALSEQAIKILAKGHFIRLFVGLETIDKNSLKRYNKDVRVQQYTELKKQLMHNHIVPHIGFILYHPYTTIEEIKNNIEFLNNAGELHRFGVVYEKMRIFPNTDLYNQLKNDGLIISQNDNDIDYCFKNQQVQKFYRHFTDSITKIGIPIFERIEYIFVCSEFINNLVDLKQQKTPQYIDAYNYILKLHPQYSKIFISLFKRCLENKLISDETQREILNLYSTLESKWENFILATINTGFNNPLEWIANGNYEPEQNYSSQYIIKTRSGCIRRTH